MFLRSRIPQLLLASLARDGFRSLQEADGCIEERFYTDDADAVGLLVDRRQKGRTPTDKFAVVRVYGEKGASWKVMENVWEKTSTYEKCGNISSERSRVKKLRESGIQGQWQHELPAREYLEQVKCCTVTDCTPRMMKQAFLALKGGDWEEHKTFPELK